MPGLPLSVGEAEALGWSLGEAEADGEAVAAQPPEAGTQAKRSR
ncbi:hypothetical protein ACFQZC_20315 [Streptacidiphilus monticola]